MAEAVVIVIVILFLLHLAGGALTHRGYYREHGAHPSLRYTYGHGWWASASVLGFRVGHRVSLLRLLACVVLIPALLAAVAVLGFRAWQASGRAAAPSPVPTVFTPSPVPSVFTPAPGR